MFLQTVTATLSTGEQSSKTVLAPLQNSGLGVEKDLLGMLKDLGRQPADNVVCPLCMKVLTSPCILPWDSLVRSVCLDCFRARCTEMSGFECPLTGEKGVDVGRAKENKQEVKR